MYHNHVLTLWRHVNMNIACIIKEEKGRLTAYTKEALPFSELLDNIAVDVSYTLLVKDDNYTVQVDFDQMLTRLKGILTKSTWSEVESLITVDIAMGYKTVTIMPYLMWNVNSSGRRELLPTEWNVVNTESVKVYSCSHGFDFDVHYGSKRISVRDEYFMKWELTELIITPNVQFPTVELNNCLPVVNGATRYPFIFENEMYIEKSSELFRSANGTNKDVTLIDFSPIGGASFIPLRDCTSSVRENFKVTITLPAGKSFKNKTPMISIRGRLFFPHELTLISETQCFVNLNKFGIDSLGLSDTAQRDAVIFNTNVYEENGMIEYLTEEFGKAKDSQDFIILIDSEDVCTIEVPADINICQQGRIFPKESTGLLINNTTREIVDYFISEYEHKDLITKTRDQLYSRILKNNPANMVKNYGFQRTNEQWYGEALFKEKVKFTLIDIASLTYV